MLNFFIKKSRATFWIISGFIAKHKRILLASALIGISSFLFITKILPILPQPKPTRRVGRVGRYNWEALPFKVRSLTSQGLTLVLEDGSVVPGLAESWEISEEGKKYLFKLRDDLVWQDEEPLKAADLIYQFSDVEIKVIDDKTLEFQLKEPFAPFPAILSAPVFKKNLIGVGKYRIRKIKKKDDFIEEIYFVSPEENLIYKFYPTLSAAVQAFKLGEIDVLEDILELTLNEDWQTAVQVEKETRKDRYFGAFFNLQDPILGDKTIRQALAYATKKEFNLKRAISPINPKSWAYNPEVKTYDFNPDKAVELFDKAFEGENEATESAENKLDLDRENLTLKISTIQTLLPLAEDIKQSWEEVLGIKVVLETINVLPEDFQIVLIGQEIPADPDQYALWHSTQEQNFTHYQSPKIDKLLEDARQLLDQAERKERYFDFQRFLVEDAPVIFLYHPETYTISRYSIKASQ